MSQSLFTNERTFQENICFLTAVLFLLTHFIEKCQTKVEIVLSDFQQTKNRAQVK